jgi:hypothetical protein
MSEIMNGTNTTEETPKDTHYDITKTSYLDEIGNAVRRTIVAMCDEIAENDEDLLSLLSEYHIEVSDNRIILSFGNCFGD